MKDSFQDHSKPGWVRNEDGSVEVIPFPIGEDSSTVPIEWDPGMLEELGIDMDTDEGMDRLTDLLGKAILRGIGAHEQAKQSYEDYASSYECEGDEWEDLGRDEIYIAGYVNGKMAP
jgi:hypothetical protein